MPNRFIKESITTSENIDKLGAEAEVLFYRLLVCCDDFGLMFAKASLVRAKCFPNRIDTIKDKDIDKWLSQLVEADLLYIYKYDDRLYLKMTKWEKHQQSRATKSKYPLPTLNGVEIIASKSQCITEKTVDTNIAEEKTEVAAPTDKEELMFFQHNQNVKITIQEYQKLLDYIKNKQTLDRYIDNLSDYILKIGKNKYKSHYATIRSWYRRDCEEKNVKNRGSTDISLFYGDSPPN